MPLNSFRTFRRAQEKVAAVQEFVARSSPTVDAPMIQPPPPPTDNTSPTPGTTVSTTTNKYSEALTTPTIITETLMPEPEPVMPTFRNIPGTGFGFSPQSGFAPTPPSGLPVAPTTVPQTLGGAVNQGIAEGLTEAIAAIPGIIAGRSGSGGSEPASSQTVPGNFAPASSSCGPGLIRVGDQCVNPAAAFPGGTPMITPAGGSLVYGRYGVGVEPTAVSRVSRKCPAGMKLGKDGICYERLARGQRLHDPGARPLLTGGEMAAIRKATRAAGRLARTQKSLKKASRALEKAC